MKRFLLSTSVATVLGLAPLAYAQPFAFGPGAMPYGPGFAMGPGMMGGYDMGGAMMGGFGMGFGAMGGYGMGSGAMGGYGDCQFGRNLSSAQRKKIAEIQQEFAQKRWQLMAEMHQQSGPMYQLFASKPTDEKAVRGAYEAMAEAHKQMFEAALQARKRIEAVLTPDPSERTDGGSR